MHRVWGNVRWLYDLQIWYRSATHKNVAPSNGQGHKCTVSMTVCMPPEPTTHWRWADNSSHFMLMFYTVSRSMVYRPTIVASATSAAMQCNTISKLGESIARKILLFCRLAHIRSKIKATCKLHLHGGEECCADAKTTVDSLAFVLTVCSLQEGQAMRQCTQWHSPWTDVGLPVVYPRPLSSRNEDTQYVWQPRRTGNELNFDCFLMRYSLIINSPSGA